MSDPSQQPLDDTVAAEPANADLPEPAHSCEQPTLLPPLDPAYGTRRQRILDLRLEAQQDPNAMRACLTGVVSDLLDDELDLGEAFRIARNASNLAFADIVQHVPLIDLKLRVGKHIVQFAQLVMRSHKDGAEPEAKKS